MELLIQIQQTTGLLLTVVFIIIIFLAQVEQTKTTKIIWVSLLVIFISILSGLTLIRIWI